MKWIKKGLIYTNKGSNDWSFNSALTPCPVLFDKFIRVYAGFRDKDGVSRIGYVDLDLDDPSIIIKESIDPVLDIGRNGCFDDNGVILGDVVYFENEIRMYYVGFQIVKKSKFLAFSGLAISNDNGENFKRVSNTPILDRNNDEVYIRAIHSVIYDDNKWKIWYASGNSWETINDSQYPNYNIRYIESNDGKNFNENSKLCVDNVFPEYRIGRPRVYKLSSTKYIMFYTKGTIQGSYFPGIAKSKDGINWVRCDEELGIELSKAGWDSETLCYPSLLFHQEKVYMFYNGNNMGIDGFGYAMLEGELWS
jgi:hypothetical protein